MKKYSQAGTFNRGWLFSLLTLRLIRKSYHQNFIASVAQLVEHHLAKVDVEGSNPFARSSREER